MPPVSNTTIAKRQIASLVNGRSGTTGYSAESARADGAFPSLLTAFCMVQFADGVVTEASPTRSLHANDDFDGEIDLNEAPVNGETEEGETGMILESESGRHVITEVWTAEDDGSISIRDPATGRHVKSESNRCVQFPRTFGTCMRQVEGFVVVGYQDGYIRIFDARTRQVLCTKKKHAAAVTALAIWKHGSKEQSDADDSYVLFCASEDFRISMWNLKSSGDATFVHHMAGHSNQVECLAVEGDFLFSGGADGYVRCWDIHIRTEVKSTESGEGGYPLYAHNGAIKDIAVVEEVLITAGTGGVCLWDIETCAAIHQFDDFGGTEEVTINRICVNPASLVLWACSSQGVVHLFDLYRFQPIGTMNDFGAANVKHLAAVAQGVTSRAFLTVKGQGLTCVYSETSDTGMIRMGGDESMAAVIKAEFETIDGLREQIVANSKLLFEQRSHIWCMRRTDEYRKEIASDWLLKSSNSEGLQRQFLERTQLFLLKTRYRERQHYLANRLAVDNDRRLLLTMWLKWSHARRESKDAFFRDFVTTAITDATHQQLVAKHLHSAITYLEQTEEKKRMEATASVFERNAQRALLRGYFFGWLRLGEKARRLDKRSEALRVMLRASNATLLRLNFSVLLRNVNNNRKERVKLHAGTMLMRSSERALSRIYFTKLLSFRREKRFLSQRSALASQLSGLLTKNYLKDGFFALAGYANQQRESKSIAAVAAAREEIEDMEKAIRDAPGDEVTEAELDAEIAEQNMELARLEEALSMEKACVDWMEKRKARLEALDAPVVEEEEVEPNSQPIEVFSAFTDDSASRAKKGVPSVFQECCTTISLFKSTSCVTTRDVDLFTATTGLLPSGASEPTKVPTTPRKATPTKAKTAIKPAAKVAPKPAAKVAPKPAPKAKKDDDKPKPKKSDAAVKGALELFNKCVDRIREQFEDTFPETSPTNTTGWKVDIATINEAPRTVLKRTLSGVRESIVLWDAVYSLWTTEKKRLGYDDSADHELYIPGGPQLRSNIKAIKVALDRDALLGAEQTSIEQQQKPVKRVASADDKKDAAPKKTATKPVASKTATTAATKPLTAKPKTATTTRTTATTVKKPAAKATTTKA